MEIPGRGQTGMERSKPKYMTNAFKNTEINGLPQSIS